MNLKGVITATRGALSSPETLADIAKNSFRVAGWSAFMAAAGVSEKREDKNRLAIGLSSASLVGGLAVGTAAIVARASSPQSEAE